MKLEIFLDYYKPLDSEMKIDKLVELCFKSMHQPICETDLSKIMDVTIEDTCQGGQMNTRDWSLSR